MLSLYLTYVDRPTPKQDMERMIVEDCTLAEETFPLRSFVHQTDRGIVNELLDNTPKDYRPGTNLAQGKITIS